MTKDLLLAALLIYSGFTTAAVVFLLLAVHGFAKRNDDKDAKIEILEVGLGIKDRLSKPK